MSTETRSFDSYKSRGKVGTKLVTSARRQRRLQAKFDRIQQQKEARA